MNIDSIVDNFVNGDYFIIFLVVTLFILLVLVLALMKSREDYNMLLNSDKKDKVIDEKKKEEVMDGFASLLADSKDDMIDADKPLIKQVDLDNIYDSTKEYEDLEEENAVISAEELEKKAQERKDALGNSESQETILKYEEEQEKKAIISYEELLKNASNISISYKKENREKGSPQVNKVEVNEQEIIRSDNYLAEEEFLKILKEFRISL